MILQLNIDKFAFGKNVIFLNQEVNISGGHMLGVVGANGTGKSTLVNIINGNLKSTAILKYNNKPLIPGYNNTIVFVSDDFIGLEYLTPIEVTQYFLLLYSRKFDEVKFNEIVSLVNMDKDTVLNQMIKTLSKGTKQKVIFIIYMMLDKDIIIFDEGLENIDETTLNHILKELKQWTSNDAKCCIIATHNKLILEYVDEYISLERPEGYVDGTKLTTIKGKKNS